MPHHDRQDAPLRRALSDLTEVRDTIPTLDEDFRQPCPGCKTELVILADQRIRRVKCGRCNEEYTLDRGMGGELCLLRFNSSEYADERAFVVRLQAMKFRVLTLVLAFVIIGSILAAITFSAWFGFGAVVGIAVGLFRADPGGRNLREERKARKRQRARRRAVPANTTSRDRRG